MISLKSLRPRVVAAGGILAAIGLSAGLAETAPSNQPPDVFNLVATYQVSGEVAEIVTATPDGMTLIYTDSGAEEIGFVSIADPRNPVEIGTVPMPDEPTSVAAHPNGQWALVVVSDNPTDLLLVVDIPTMAVIHSIPLGGQPDSVAVSPNGRYAVVVIENERDEDVNDGEMPQLPAGFLTIVDLVGPPASWTTRDVNLTGIAQRFPEDPEPEFIDISADSTQVVVTLQENNHIAIVDLATGTIEKHFSAGTTSHKADLQENLDISLSDKLTDARREPDAIHWTPRGRLATANEGDYDLDLQDGQFTGGRDFTIFDTAGKVIYEPKEQFEQQAVNHGHYDDDRSENAGTEPEGIEIGTYGNKTFLFVGSERGAFVSVYQLDSSERRPRFIQLLPTGVRPEGLYAIPSRDLFVAANEADDGIIGSISIFEGAGRADYPDVYSERESWSALSGLTIDSRWDAYAVPDSAMAPSRIWELTLGSEWEPITIRSDIPLTKDGQPLSYDLEGITAKSDGGFWLVSEGAATTNNLLIEVDRRGRVQQEIELPASLNAVATTSGFEGVATSKDGSQVYVAIQREWGDDPAGLVKIGRYTVATGQWHSSIIRSRRLSPAAGSGCPSSCALTTLPSLS